MRRMGGGAGGRRDCGALPLPSPAVVVVGGGGGCCPRVGGAGGWLAQLPCLLSPPPHSSSPSPSLSARCYDADGRPPDDPLLAGAYGLWDDDDDEDAAAAAHKTLPPPPRWRVIRAPSAVQLGPNAQHNLRKLVFGVQKLATKWVKTLSIGQVLRMDFSSFYGQFFAPKPIP